MHRVRTAFLIVAVLSVTGFDASAPYSMTNLATGEQISCIGDACVRWCAMVGFAGNEPEEERSLMTKGRLYIELKPGVQPQPIAPQEAQQAKQLAQSLREQCLLLAVPAKH
jgi:hypothetical protein